MELNTGYTETQRGIAGFVESLAKKYGRPYIRGLVSSGATFPEEMWNEVAKAGYLGMIIPEEFGGTPVSYDDVRVFFTEMGRHGLITLHFVSYFMDCLLVGSGNQAMKEKYLPGLAAGEYWSFAITEPSAGTNTFNMKTSAVREGLGYRINGQKVFITGFAESKYLVLVTKTDVKGEGPRKDAFSLFVIDRDAPGVSCTPMNLGLHFPERQYTVFFDNVVVPEENRIGDEGAGLGILFNALNLERIVIAALSLGLGQHVFAKGVAYAKERTLFRGPIGSHQGVQHMLARAFVKLQLANLANREAALAFDRGDNQRTVGMYANMAKLACTEAAFEAGDAAFQVHGGSGIADECDVATILPMIRTLRVAPINNEMTLNYLGEKCLDLPKSY